MKLTIRQEGQFYDFMMMSLASGWPPVLKEMLFETKQNKMIPARSTGLPLEKGPKNRGKRCLFE